MAVFERSTLVRAPFEDVWAFHSTVEGVVAVTPEWLGLTVERVVGPDGQPDPDELLEGSEVTFSMRPFGVGPRLPWTSRITHRERTGDAAEFRDTMLDGPFRRWHHTHRFIAVPAGTRLTDRVEYQLPLGPVRGLSAAAWPGFAAIFRSRQRRTKQRLE